MDLCVISSYPTSLRKVAKGVYEYARTSGRQVSLYSVGERAPLDCRKVVVEYAEESQLAYDVPYFFYGRCVAYLTAEGVPQLSPQVRELVQRCYVAAPHSYVKSLLEEAGLRVDAVVPHHVEWRDLRAARPAYDYGFTGINLWRKGVDLAVKMAELYGGRWLINTTNGEVRLDRVPPNVRLTFGWPDVYQLYSQVGVLVLPSRAEGFSLAPREFAASRCVKPVVTDLPVYHEPWYIKCPVKRVLRVPYRGQLTPMYEPDVERCRPRAEPLDCQEARSAYPLSVYRPLIETL